MPISNRAIPILALSIVAASPWIAPAVEPADLVLRNGLIVTVDETNPRVRALAAQGEKIVALGSDREVEPFIGEKTRVFDLNGRLAIPGFIEGHGHLLALGESRLAVDLRQARGWDEVVESIRQASLKSPAGQWIIGAGWHQEHWDRPPRPDVEGYPVHASLSRATPDHPVLLKHATGHMSFANARAMELAGVGADTANPQGGQILRDGTGRPTGAFRETAQSLISRAWDRALERQTPAERRARSVAALALAMDECLAKGVTSFQDAGSSFETIDLFQTLADEGKLPLRLWVMVSASAAAMREKLPTYRKIGYANDRLTVRAIKKMADGALGSHGAWLFEPYADLPQSHGLVVESIDSIRETALLAAKHEFQLCTHAIGDRAIRETLDLYQAIMRSVPARQEWRWRIEHAQHVHPDDFPRFAELGVIASMQANHATSDGPFVIARLGERRARAESYAWRSLLDHKALIVGGTDVPVEGVNPILCFHAAITRRMRNGQAFFPEQCMTRDEALRSYTRDAAFAAFEEHSKGTLAVGKLADVVVLSRNILEVPSEEIPRTEVVWTIVGGKVAFERPESPRTR